MPTPSQLTPISQDASFREDATIYADHAMRTLRATDIRQAIQAAYLRGGDAAFNTGYRIGQRQAQSSSKC